MSSDSGKELGAITLHCTKNFYLLALCSSNIGGIKSLQHETEEERNTLCCVPTSFQSPGAFCFNSVFLNVLNLQRHVVKIMTKLKIKEDG